MNKKEIIENLFQRRRAGIKPGLGRMDQAVKLLQNPQDSYKIMHIAGTNGKGSTAHMIASVLEAAGHRVGLFTSPHIIDFNERYLINNKPVTDNEWLAVWLKIQPVADELDLTFFEISALLAFQLFADEECDWVVLETGLGGRLDATNVVTPELAIITALSVEHTEYLGDTIEEIAFEKLGIVKKNKPCIFNGDNLASVKNLAKTICVERGSELIFSETSGADYDAQSGRVTITAFEEPFQLPLYGEFQKSNVATVLSACAQLGIPVDAVKAGLQKVTLPARFQVVEYKDNTIIFDVAHNPQALEVLTKTAVDSFGDSSITVVLGMMADKDVEKSCKILSERFHNIVAVSPAVPRALAVSKLYDILKDSDVNAYKEMSVDEGIKKACTLTKIVIVTGSFFTVSEAMIALAVSPY